MCVYIYIIPPAKQGWCAHLWTTSGIGVFRSTYSQLQGLPKLTTAAWHASQNTGGSTSLSLTCHPKQLDGHLDLYWWSFILVISCDFWCILAGQIDLAAFCSNLSGRSVALTEMGRARGQLLDNPWCVMVPWCFSQFFSRSMGSLCGFQ